MTATDCQTFFLGQLPSKLDTQTWVALVVAILATAYLVLRAKAKSRKDPLQRPAGAGLGLAQQRTVERQMSNLLVELSEMARAVSAGLDTRAAKLQVLIDEADQRIEELKRLGGSPAMRGAPSGSTGAGTSDDHSRQPATPLMRIVDDSPVEVIETMPGSAGTIRVSAVRQEPAPAQAPAPPLSPTPATASATVASRTSGSSPRGYGTDESIDTSSASPPDACHEHVYRLADEGKISQEIAMMLDRPRGEIELILALRPRQAAGHH